MTSVWFKPANLGFRGEYVTPREIRQILLKDAFWKSDLVTEVEFVLEPLLRDSRAANISKNLT